MPEAKREMPLVRESKIHMPREVSVGIDFDGVSIDTLERNLLEMSEGDLHRFFEEHPNWRLRRYDIAYAVDELEGFENIFIP